MIKSLYEINKALVDLSTELSNPKSSNESIRKSIQNLLSEVKYLE
jgi:cell division protein FtsL